MSLARKTEALTHGIFDNAPYALAGAAFGGVFRGVAETNNLFTGARQIETVGAWDKAERQANHYYKKIRSAKSNSDVTLISKNTGIPEYWIQRIKDHLFMNQHILSEDRVGRFDPYIEIVDSWERLQSGNHVHQDIELLSHEYFESRFEALYKTDYTTAHNAAVRSGRDWNPDGFITEPEMSWRP